ncbi:MAG TPA: transcriptional regulator [Ktedonobacteraceae bacterium]|nr:transcriptional regulator [Ktedonobacteraceae bacterium]
MAQLNEIIHQPARLRIMSVLVSLDSDLQPSFNYLKDLLELTDGNLGAHLRKLEEAGYIEICKTFINNKPHTYVEVTSPGRSAFAEHVAALQDILKTNGHRTNDNIAEV